MRTRPDFVRNRNSPMDPIAPDNEEHFRAQCTGIARIEAHRDLPDDVVEIPPSVNSTPSIFTLATSVPAPPLVRLQLSAAARSSAQLFSRPLVSRAPLAFVAWVSASRRRHVSRICFRTRRWRCGSWRWEPARAPASLGQSHAAPAAPRSDSPCRPEAAPLAERDARRPPPQ